MIFFILFFYINRTDVWQANHPPFHLLLFFSILPPVVYLFDQSILRCSRYILWTGRRWYFCTIHWHMGTKIFDDIVSLNISRLEQNRNAWIYLKKKESWQTSAHRALCVDDKKKKKKTKKKIEIKLSLSSWQFLYGMLRISLSLSHSYFRRFTVPERDCWLTRTPFKDLDTLANNTISTTVRIYLVSFYLVLTSLHYSVRREFQSDYTKKV